MIMNCLQSTLNISFCSPEERNLDKYLSLEIEIKIYGNKFTDHNNISIFVVITINIVRVVLSKYSICMLYNHLPQLQKSSTNRKVQ